MARPKSQDSAASARARAAALHRWAFEDTIEGTRKAREGFLRSFELQVDPELKLDPAEREKRARRLLRAHMSKLGRRSGEARRRG